MFTVCYSYVNGINIYSIVCNLVEKSHLLNTKNIIKPPNQPTTRTKSTLIAKQIKLNKEQKNKIIKFIIQNAIKETVEKIIKNKQVNKQNKINANKKLSKVSENFNILETIRQRIIQLNKILKNHVLLSQVYFNYYFKILLIMILIFILFYICIDIYNFLNPGNIKLNEKNESKMEIAQEKIDRDFNTKVNNINNLNIKWHKKIHKLITLYYSYMTRSLVLNLKFYKDRFDKNSILSPIAPILEFIIGILV